MSDAVGIFEQMNAVVKDFVGITKLANSAFSNLFFAAIFPFSSTPRGGVC